MYIPRFRSPKFGPRLFWLEFWPCLGGFFPSTNRGQLGSRYIYIHTWAQIFWHRSTKPCHLAFFWPIPYFIATNNLLSRSRVSWSFSTCFPCWFHVHLLLTPVFHREVPTRPLCLPWMLVRCLLVRSWRWENFKQKVREKGMANEHVATYPSLKWQMGPFPWKGGTPKSSILNRVSIVFTIHFEVPLFLETPK